MEYFLLTVPSRFCRMCLCLTGDKEEIKREQIMKRLCKSLPKILPESVRILRKLRSSSEPTDQTPRYKAASILDRENVNLGSIQRILGHENRTTTEIYLHSIGEAERQAMQVYERVSKESHISPT